MKSERRVVTQMPLCEVWNEHGVISTNKVRELDAFKIVDLLHAGRVRFVVANGGHHLNWVPVEDCYVFWKSEVKIHLAESDVNNYLEDFPGEYCYFASEWKADNGEPIVLLAKSH